MKLSDILGDLEKSAGYNFEEDSEGNDVKDEKASKGDKTSKDGKRGAKEDDKDQEKSAAFKAGSNLAKEIMEKVASSRVTQTNFKGTEMNKQASDAGKALAHALLTKLAGIGDESTTNGIMDGVFPNKTQQDLAQQVAEHNAIFQATPGTDGAGNGGTVNQIFDEIVADAQGHGVVNYGGQTPSAMAEGIRNAIQAPSQVEVDDSQEKMAAAVELVYAGVDFNDAVDLVKAASNELDYEEDLHTKQAAVDALIGAGVDFNDAVYLVKEASDALDYEEDLHIKQAAVDELIEAGVDFYDAVSLIKEASSGALVVGAAGKGSETRYQRFTRGARDLRDAGMGYAGKARDAAKAYGENLLIDAKALPFAFKGLASEESRKGMATGMTRDAIKKSLLKNRALHLGAGALALGAGGAAYALTREKKAAFDELVYQGVDFEDAAFLVESKSQEIYGY